MVSSHPLQRIRRFVPSSVVSIGVLLTSVPIFASEPLPGTVMLTSTDDLAAKMVEGIDRYLTRLNEQARLGGNDRWKLDHSSTEAYRRSIEPNRDRLRRILGIVDSRVSPVVMEYLGRNSPSSVVGAAESYLVHRVRWGVLDGVDGEGLLLEPTGPVKAQVVVIPDADQSPEQWLGLSPGIAPESQFPGRLAASGCRVLLPALINRRPTEPPSPLVPRTTNIPHREFIWRMAYEMGRHIIGLEVQKILAALDWFSLIERSVPIGVFGYGEGGIIALYAGAVDSRIGSTVVSGVPFNSRHRVWEEPIDRSIWAALPEFRDELLVQMFGDGRTLIFEHAHPPKFELANPPGYRQQAAPGRLFSTDEASRQIAQATEKRSVIAQNVAVPGGDVSILAPPDGTPAHEQTLQSFATSLSLGKLAAGAAGCERKGPPEDGAEQHRRQFRQMVDYIQRLWRRSDAVRRQFFAQADFSSPEAWQKSATTYRDYFWREVIGKLPEPTVPMNPRSRRIYDEPKWSGYEVVLDVYPDVFAFGHLLVPKDIQPGEKRPVVVCQHGLEGRPDDLTDPRRKNVYHQLGARLADMGYIVFAPQNPYIGWEKFRILRRRSDPLQLSLFSFIVRQHERILDWLSTLPQVDPQRIGFYGLSYGGKTAMRIPAILERYALSICSADFNEWIGKNVTIDLPLSYMYTIEYDMYEFNLGNTFNYAEMAFLIAPRPFMVERGHVDGVGIDEMVASEYAKVRYLYANRLRIPERTAIEFFAGGHEIRLHGTAEFLRRHLNWPK